MYSFNSRVRYSEVGQDGRLAFSSAVHYMQDCAIFHSESVGEGVRDLKDEGRVWLLSSWQIEVRRRPVLGEKICVSTWPCGFKAMYGYRNFVISGESGGQDIRAYSIWSYLDLAAGRPVKVPEELVERYGPEPALDMETAGRKIRIPAQLHERGEFPVQRFQIDTNGHVNNVQYIQMASPFLPEDDRLVRLRAEYKKAAVYGDRIRIMENGGEETRTVVLQSPDGQVFAVIEAAGRKGSL